MAGIRRLIPAWALGAVSVAALACASLGPRAAGATGRVTAPAPIVVRPPGVPWLLVNTTASAPAVTWTGPGLVVVDSPEVLTGALLRSVSGGAADAHLLYADRSPGLPQSFRLFLYMRNALDRPVDVWFRLEASASMTVHYSPAAVAASGLPPQALAVGGRVAQAIAGRAALRWSPADRVPAGRALRVVWAVPPGELLCVWWPILAVAADGRPVSLTVWEGPDPQAPAGSALPPDATSVGRTTLAHGDGTVTLRAPAGGAWAYDLDNDAPTPAGTAGGSLCPPAVCLSGEVTTGAGAPFDRAADPLPGEMEGGVDALDAPGHAPAAAIWHDGSLLRTGNYGDYGARLTLHLTAPRGRDVFAAVVPGYDHAAPWSGTTTEAGRASVAWCLPTTPPPPGTGYQIAADAPSATVTTTVTPGAYAPLRVVVWSEPAP